MRKYKITELKPRLFIHLRLYASTLVLTTLLACQTGPIASNSYSQNPAKLSIDTCEKLVVAEVLPVKKYLHFAVPSERTHSMSRALPNYVCQKIPCLEIEEVVNSGGTIKVIGAPPEVLKLCKDKLNLPEFSKNEITRQKPGKRENIYRPVFYTTQEGVKNMYISVMAGEDYIQQVSAMVAYDIEAKTGKDLNKVVSVISFPKLESSIADWTDLDSFVKPDDTVLIGNVAYFYDYVRENEIKELIDEKESFFYKSTRVRFKSRILNFLIVKHTFWAGMSARLANVILKKGVFELIYMSKVATLSSTNDVYNKIYSPSRFFRLKSGKVESIGNLKNRFAEYFPALDSGTHLSVSTVMEEDLKMTDVARSLGARSLDLEISGIVKEIANSNMSSSRSTRFSSVHIVTDYLRGKGEIDKETTHDLSNSRSAEATVLKKKSWAQIYKLMLEYLGSKT